MRIAIYSDIHTEAHFDSDGARDSGEAFIAALDPTDVDVVVLAGDIGTLDGLRRTIELFAAKYRHVVFVPGNHEHWHCTRSDIRAAELSLEGWFPNFHWLNREVVTIEGQRFIGATLWFRDHPMNEVYSGRLADFFNIPGFRTWIYEENAKAIAFLEREARGGDVVITHHAPSAASREERYAGSETNRFYICDMVPLILERQPRLWIHGHMHASKDYQIEETRVVCNPYGYQVTFLNPQFDPRKIIEV
jgi:Icc-related predicted phosphoesterase